MCFSMCNMHINKYSQAWTIKIRSHSEFKIISITNIANKAINKWLIRKKRKDNQKYLNDNRNIVIRNF